MAHGRDSTTPLQRLWRSVREAAPAWVLRRERVTLAVGAVAVFALALRFWTLGHRPAHWDEARVAYWALRYEETGAMAYRHIIHGPFIQHAARPLFALFGASDFTARVPVAVIGGLAPLAALLYREHLRDAETITLALLLATNSIVLYYGRYYRSDVLVATFMLTAFGMLVRYYDTGRYRYVFGATAFLAFGVASKENAVLYALTWLGAATLVVDTSLYRPRSGESGLAVCRRKLGVVRASVSSDGSIDGRALGRWLGVRVGVTAGAAALFGALWLYFFAARGDAIAVRPIPDYVTVTFWEGITNPLQLPTLVVETAEYWSSEYFSWLGTAGGSEDRFLGGITGNFAEFAPDYWRLLGTYALPSVTFAVLGFVYERYVAVTSRNLVQFFGYAGFVSMLAYPGALDIFGPWNATHAAVPLMIPAAAGLGALYYWGRDAFAAADYASAGLTALVLLLVVGNVAVTSVGGVYLNDRSGENMLVQYGQPADDMRPALDRLHETAAANEGTDVLLYGEFFVAEDPSEQFLPTCMGDSGWFDGLPVPWYLEASDAEVVCARNESDLPEGDLPPVVITREGSVGEIQNRLASPEKYTYRIRTSGSETAFLYNGSLRARS